MSLTQKETTTTATVSTATTTASTDVDLTQLFPARTVRSQLNRHVTNLPSLSVEHAALIGTTSALLFKNFLDRLSDRTIVKAVDIQQVVVETPAFAFLLNPLEENGGMKELVQKENRNYSNPYHPKRKREGTSLVGAKKVAKAVVDNDKETNGGIDSKRSTDPIIQDDDDYD